MSFRFSPARAPVAACEAMVACSQPLASVAGLDILRAGGNAVDAALAMAGALCVTEPEGTGVGGDLFAVVRAADGGLWGLDAAGPAPAGAPAGPPAPSGPRSVDVPGAVAGWDELAGRFGRLGLDRCLAPAIDLAERGVAVGANCARAWRGSGRAPSAFGPVPPAGARIRFPELAATLRRIASHGRAAVYEGPIAQTIAGASWLTEQDLAAYRPRWVEPLTAGYRGIEVAALPAPSQGVAVLEALALLDDVDPGLVEEIGAVSLALEDALATVRDGADVIRLLSAEHLARRRAQRPGRVAEPAGGTVCLCAVDGDGLAVSMMQSLYEPFGSGVVAGSTGIVLNNRAACFAVQGEVVPGRRPYHTLTPAMLTRGGDLVGPFGVMGGFIQAQAEVQFVVELMRNGLDPQAALDRPRFRVAGDTLSLEEPLWDHADELTGLGLRIDRSADRASFGGGQAIIRRDGALFGGSDARKDGCALGL